MTHTKQTEQTVSPERIRYCCPCHFGLESVLKFELSRIGATDIAAANGKVSFSGDLAMLAKANIHLTVAERVLIELATFPVGAQRGKTAFDPLFDGVMQIPLEQFIGKDDAFPVKGSSLNSQLSSVPACQSIVKKAAVKRLQRAYHTQTLPETGAIHQLQFNIMHDVCTVYLDTSGFGLHKRGWRQKANAAPIRETLAAGILDLSRVRFDTQLCDPFCGSGTMLIEGACRAMRIAPGLRRRYAAERWGSVPAKLWAESREEARALIQRDVPFTAVGYDIDPEAVSLSLENAKKAGVAEKITVKQADIRDFQVVAGQTIVCNPPYGERMLDVQQAQELYRIMGKVFRGDCACSIISPDAEFEKHFGRKADKRRKLYNGMLQCQLHQYFAPRIR
ncbi:MAG: class I SAM-dependent RNA methyltransferase [Oscillospiraceae bacterium]|nr:class I SAM-dependent RNA methyltransferase [Oscillospiraceae bacterium]